MPGFISTRFGKPIKKSEYEDLSVEQIRDLTKTKIQKLISGDY